MKLKNKDILNFVNGCASLREKRLPVKLGYAIKKNLAAVSDAANAYDAERQELLEKYAAKVRMESSWLRMGSIPSRTKRALQKTWMSSWRLRQRLVFILFLRKRLRNVMIHVMMP